MRRQMDIHYKFPLLVKTADALQIDSFNLPFTIASILCHAHSFAHVKPQLSEEFATNNTCSSMSACQQVFALPELRGQIFVQVPPKNLLRAQQVNRRFRSMITSSQVCQRHLGFARAPVKRVGGRWRKPAMAGLLEPHTRDNPNLVNSSANKGLHFADWVLHFSLRTYLHLQTSQAAANTFCMSTPRTVNAWDPPLEHGGTCTCVVLLASIAYTSTCMLWTSTKAT